MGGVSQSGFEVRQGAGEEGDPAGIFSGQVSSSNNGGFASVSPPHKHAPVTDIACQATDTGYRHRPQKQTPEALASMLAQSHVHQLGSALTCVCVHLLLASVAS